MFLDKSLEEFTLADFKLAPQSLDYTFDFSDDATVARIMFDYLTSNPGFIRHERSVALSRKQKKAYLDAVHKIVSKGAPLEIFITAFSPKINDVSYTNNACFPDMADCLSLLHLHFIAKQIREIYDYGFRFIIGYKGTLYQELYGWSDEVVKTTLNKLKDITKSIEKIAGIRNVVEFVDLSTLVEKEGHYLKENIQSEYRRIKDDYFNNPESVFPKKINSWISNFSKGIDKTRFESEEKMNDFLFNFACYQFAFKYKAYSGGSFNLGITNSYPNTLIATVRGMGKQLSFQLNPHFKFHSHQRLILLDKGEWETFKWSDFEEGTLEPVFIKNFDYPFYYVKK